MTPFRSIFGCDLRTLAIFRIGLGIGLWADLLDRGRDLRAHYTYWGILPQPPPPESWLDYGAHLLLGSTWFEAGTFVVAGLAGVALIVGYHTRLATILCWGFQAYIQSKIFLVLNAGDILLLLMLFWSIFLPIGARYSVDAAVDVTPSEDSPNAFFSMGTLVILLQVACLYFFSAIHKMISPAWIPDGTILHYVFHFKGFVLPLGEWLREFPHMIQGFTYFAWGLELLGPFLLFSPWFFLPLRGVFLLLFVGLHLGILLCMNVGLFPLHNFVSLILFIPGWCWDKLMPALRSAVGTGLTIYYDSDCEFCRKICLLLKTILVLPEVPLLPAQEHPSIFEVMERDNTWVVKGQDGVESTRWDAVLLLVRYSPIFWPVARVLDVSLVHRIGTCVYRWIANHRTALSGFTRLALPYHRGRDLRPPFMMEVLVGFLGVYMVFINITTLHKLPYWPFSISDPIAIVKRTLHINQQWHMFASPTTRSRWVIIPGQLIDGTEVDVYNSRYQLPNLDDPQFEDSLFHNNRWRKYLENMLNPKYKKDHIDQQYADYLCRSWNEVHPPLEHLLNFEILVVVEDIPPPFSEIVPHKQMFSFKKHSCLKTAI